MPVATTASRQEALLFTGIRPKSAASPDRIRCKISSAAARKQCPTEGSQIDESHEPTTIPSTGEGLVTVGAVIAVLLGIPCIFFSLYGLAGVVTGEKLVAGALGALWSYMAVAGAYELNRRKFDWDRGRKRSDLHLLGGTIAVSTGLMLSGAVQELMPVLAIVPALSAIKQAHAGHDTKLLSWIHAGILMLGVVIGIWLYNDKFRGQALLDRLAALP